MAAELDAFQQADDHPDIRQHGRCPHGRLAQNLVFQSQFGFQRPFGHWLLVDIGSLLIGFCRRIIRPALRLAAATRVKSLLQPFAGGRPVVSGAALIGTPPAMVPATTERATQIHATGAARMRQKANPAVSAEGHAVLQSRMGPQYRVQRDLILTNKRPGAIEFMPIRTKRENSLDGDDKKARLSVITRSLFFTPSSYLLDAKAPRGRARFFCAIKKIQNAALGANDTRRIVYPNRPPCRANPSSLRPPSSNDYLERSRKIPARFSFQVVEQFS